MKLKIVRNIKPNRNMVKRIAAVVASLAIIAVSSVIITNADRDAKNTVEVLRVKNKEGLNAQQEIKKDDIEKYKVIAREYTKDMVLGEKSDEVVGMYVKNYSRKGMILFADQLLEEKPLKNEWLYQLGTETEVVTIPYNYLECGGDILTPGDRVRIRVSYEASGGGFPDVSGEKVKVTAVLFDSIIVKDMLNSSGHSIYEVYKEVLKMETDKRQQVMQSEDFIKNIQPRALLLEGDRTQIDNYARYKGVDAQSFLVTILSRKNSTIVLDELPTLEKEVESWIQESKK